MITGKLPSKHNATQQTSQLKNSLTDNVVPFTTLEQMVSISPLADTQK
jgi:hypothetical protein